MSLVTQLIGFGLRQVIGDYAGNAVEVVEQRFRDPSRTLPKALDHAHDRAWQAIGVALAGDGLLDRVKVFFATGDDKGIREQVRLFLKDNAFSFDGTPDGFRRVCLDELNRLRKSGLLLAPEGSSADIARQAAGFKRHADLPGLVDEAKKAVAGVADALRENYPNLSKLIRRPTPAGPPLLAAAFCYFFRREVETNGELARGLLYDGQRQFFASQKDMLGCLEQLSASQATAFGEVNKALATLGVQFDALFEQLGRIEVAVLDIQAELQRLGGLGLGKIEEVRSMLEQVQQHLAQAGMQKGEVRPQHSFSINGEDERRAVRSLLDRLRQLPPQEREKLPALHNGLGKIQFGTGDFGGAMQTFDEATRAASGDAARAEARYNAYRAALEARRWDEALAELRQAIACDPARFAPYPADKYEVVRILGAGGFGVTFLAKHRHSRGEVALKALEVADLDRDVNRVFEEAQTLDQLQHPAIIRLRDCGFADTAGRHPYLVMDYFPGETLEARVRERGLMPVADLVPLARRVAEALQAAHARNILHRDVKPANVMLRQQGGAWDVRLIDFGLALRQEVLGAAGSTARSGKTVAGSSIAGTLDYAAPEQMGRLPGVPVGAYSDVYGFGKTCCFALFGTPNLSYPDWKEIEGPLADLLGRCVAERPEKRPSDFQAVLAGLADRLTALLTPKAGDVSTNSLGMKFAFVPRGSFLMGGGGGKPGDKQVTIEHDFRLGVYPVTQGQWQAVVGSNPSHFSRTGDGKDDVKDVSDAELKDFPIERVSWDDVQDFLGKLNEREKDSGFVYRLPTEAEWEYACRGAALSSGGSMSKEECSFDFYFQPQPTNALSSRQANFNGKYPCGGAGKGPYLGRTCKVGSYQPNRLGIYDLHGNVWEWCQDTDDGGETRVFRGGGCYDGAKHCGAATRDGGEPGWAGGHVGVRLVQAVAHPEPPGEESSEVSQAG